jgi:hypothetical protein
MGQQVFVRWKQAKKKWKKLMFKELKELELT